MEMHYRKSDNTTLFSNFKDSSLLNTKYPQSYIPLYSRFFELNPTNYNSINLNHSRILCEIIEKKTENKFLAKIKDKRDIVDEKPVFFKLSPLLDPIKFLIGKYQNDEHVLTLPDLNPENSHDKFNNANNASYVDGFFTYLTSMLLHNHKFIHGVDFYGSFLAIKRDYKFNIYDDIEYLQDSEFFKLNNGKQNNNITFSLDNKYVSDIIGGGSKYNKKKLTLPKNNSEGNCELTLSDIKDINALDTLFINKEHPTGEMNLLYDGHSVVDEKKKDSTSSTSTCSSRSSNTQSESSRESDTDDDSDNESHYSNSDSESGSSDEDVEEELFVNISEFPIQIIALEQCDQTLDSLLSKTSLSDEEWDSIVLQIIMTLLTYQKVFDLTHNDLHTNNIMYINTKQKYLYYHINNKNYRVPTFGRIYKIIDFGRAIYKYNGKLICSDSFHTDGDAATQYNCLPYINKKKPIILPNPSFDLCRLGCSLFDFIVDELEDTNEIEDIKDIDNIKSTIKKIIINWCKDDKGRNIIYKSNGDERYPEFKLYKMIARTVNNHSPNIVLNNPYFNKYIIQSVSKKAHVLNIDNYPCLQ